jgi:GH43 family beta-xylosidase
MTENAVAEQRCLAPARPLRPILRLEKPAAPPISGGTFCNPIARGADPWVIRHECHYFFCEPVRDTSIAVWRSDRLTVRGTRHIVWRAPRNAWNSQLIWAPELHHLGARWYIYYTASAGRKDNASHRIGVLESRTADPCGAYRDCGAVYAGDDPHGRSGNRWGIDATILDLHDRRYLLWSGWPGERDEQYLYASRLENPWTTTGPRVRLCDNATYAWERVGDDPRQRGLHEAPQVLQHDGRVFVVYSCSGSWQPTYKLGLLELVGNGDPLDPRNWHKHPEPVFQSAGGVCGVGHASFVKSADGREEWLIYHAKASRAEGWRRVVCAQRFGWRADGLPDFGQPLPWHAPLALPSGERRVASAPPPVASAPRGRRSAPQIVRLSM